MLFIRKIHDGNEYKSKLLGGKDELTVNMLLLHLLISKMFLWDSLWDR